MLLPVVAAVLSDALEIDRVLSARSSFDVLDVSADSAEVRSCAHRMLMRSVHPDHHCRSPHAAVCEAAHRTSLLVNDARDQLLAKTTNQEPESSPEAENGPEAPGTVRGAASLGGASARSSVPYGDRRARSACCKHRKVRRQFRQARMPAAKLRELRLPRYARAACPRSMVIAPCRACACAWLLR